jgi:hypothetical protein
MNKPNLAWANHSTPVAVSSSDSFVASASGFMEMVFLVCEHVSPLLREGDVWQYTLL